MKNRGTNSAPNDFVASFCKSLWCSKQAGHKMTQTLRTHNLGSQISFTIRSKARQANGVASVIGFPIVSFLAWVTPATFFGKRWEVLQHIKMTTVSKQYYCHHERVREVKNFKLSKKKSSLESIVAEMRNHTGKSCWYIFRQLGKESVIGTPYTPFSLRTHLLHTLSVGGTPFQV